MTVHRVRDAVAEDATYWGDPRMLVKLLDPAHRLLVHAHPSRAFAREHLGSAFGKTEAWVVVATRGETTPRRGSGCAETRS